MVSLHACASLSKACLALLSVAVGKKKITAPSEYVLSTPLGAESDPLQFDDRGFGTRHNGQVALDDGRDIRVRHVCSTFQGKLRPGPLLGQTAHAACDLVPVIVRLQVGAKPDAEYFHRAVRPNSHDVDAGQRREFDSRVYGTANRLIFAAVTASYSFYVLPTSSACFWLDTTRVTSSAYANVLVPQPSSRRMTLSVAIEAQESIYTESTTG